MNKFYFILLLCLFSSCRINKTNHVETCKTENDSTEQFYDQSEGMEILDTLGKVYGNEPHIAGLSLETPNCPDFIEGIYFDKATLVFQVTGDTVKARQILEKASGNLEELDVEQTLARLAAREEQGVTFVNIERTDRKGERIRGACIGAALFVALMAFVIATMAWAFYSDPQEAPPLPLLIVLFGIPVGCIVGTLKVLLERIEEIGKGEEDAYRNY
jgi:hypothetical protein